MSSKRPTVALSALIVGLGAGIVGAVVSIRRAPTAPPSPPIGRVGEPGHHWTVDEQVLVHRSAGEVAQHLHDHGGLPGLTGGLQGPAMDRIEWDVEGTGHLEVEVHGLPGVDRTTITARVAPQQTGVAGAAHAATALVLGTTVRAQVRADLDALRRRLEGSPDSGVRASTSGAAPGQGA